MTKAPPMLRKFVTALIVIPLAAVIIAFAVANRQIVTVSFDPFSSVDPAYAATLPLFAVILLVLILGVLVGGVAAWLRQSKWRRAARNAEAEVRVLHQELAAVRARTAVPEPLPPEPTTYPVIAPPV